MKKTNIFIHSLLLFCMVSLFFSCSNKQEKEQVDDTTALKENPDMEYRTLGSTGLRVGTSPSMRANPRSGTPARA